MVRTRGRKNRGRIEGLESVRDEFLGGVELAPDPRAFRKLVLRGSVRNIPSKPLFLFYKKMRKFASFLAIYRAEKGRLKIFYPKRDSDEIIARARKNLSLWKIKR